MRQVIFVFASTISVYGDVNSICDETTLCTPSTPYAISKRQAEIALKEIASVDNEQILWILRFGTIIGKDDRGNLNRIIRAARRYRIVPRAPERIKKSFIHVDDVAAIILKIAKTGGSRPGGTFNVCGPPVELSEIFDHIASMIGRCFRPRFPKILMRMVSPKMSHSVEIQSKAIQKELSLQFKSFGDAFWKEYSSK